MLLDQFLVLPYLVQDLFSGVSVGRVLLAHGGGGAHEVHEEVLCGQDAALVTWVEIENCELLYNFPLGLQIRPSITYQREPTINCPSIAL